MDEQNQQQTLPPPQPQVPPQNVNPPPAPQQRNWIKWVLIIVFVVLLASITTYFVLTFQSQKPPPPQIVQTPPSPTPSSSPTPDETANWKTYTDNELGIQYKYPSNLQTIKSNKDDLYIASYTIGKYIDPKLPGVPSLDRIDIQILPQDSQFLLDERKSFFNLQVGKSIDISPINTKQFGEGPWTFKRLPDIDVNGNVGKTFISNGVWQASAGSYEKRTYVMRNNYIYMFRSYIVGGEITEKIFDQILSTFRFD